MESSEATVGAGASPETGLLIDFSDEERIPYPQQLMLTAEVDDTFGIFMSRSNKAGSFPGVMSARTASGDIFSPKFFPGNESTDSVFELTETKSTPKSTSVGKMLNRKLSVLSGISNISSIRDSSVSTCGFNEGFVESSDLLEGPSSASASGNEVDASQANSDKENSPLGIMEASPDKNSSQLFDLSGFTVSDDGENTEGTPNKTKNNVSQASVDTDQSDIFSRVFKRQSIRKQGNEVIAKKVQEMFDAASPSKNPQLFTTIPKFRTYTPARKPTISESFSYATPKRVSVLSGSVATSNLSFTSSPTSRVQPPPQVTTPKSALTGNAKRPERGSGNVIASPSQESPGVEEVMKELSIKEEDQSFSSRMHTPISKRLSFSSNSSDSGKAIPSFSKVKQVKTAVIHPRIQPLIQIQTKPKRLGGSHSESTDSKDVKPMKAFHSVVPVTAGSKAACAASAPVYRKFPVPVATSSPIIPAVQVHQVGTPPRPTRSSLARQNVGQQRASMSPSAKALNTSQSRIPQSPSSYGFKPPQEHNTRPVPQRKTLIKTSSNEFGQNRASLTSATAKRRSYSSSDTTKVNHAIQRHGISKDFNPRLKKLDIPKM